MKEDNVSQMHATSRRPYSIKIVYSSCSSSKQLSLHGRTISGEKNKYIYIDIHTYIHTSNT